MFVFIFFALGHLYWWALAAMLVGTPAALRHFHHSVQGR